MSAAQCKVLFLGRNGVGKSTCAAGGLGGGEEACKQFPSGDSARPVTQKATMALAGGGILLQDPPGTIEADSKQVAANLRCVEECVATATDKPTHIVFVIATDNGRVNHDDVRVVRGMAASFGLTAKHMPCVTIVVNQVPARVAGDAAFQAQFAATLAEALQLPPPPADRIHFVATWDRASASSVPPAVVAAMKRVLAYAPSAGLVLKARAGGVSISGTWAEAEAERKRAAEAQAAQQKREAEAQARREAEAAAARRELAAARSMMSSGPSVSFSFSFRF